MAKHTCEKCGKMTHIICVGEWLCPEHAREKVQQRAKQRSDHEAMKATVVILIAVLMGAAAAAWAWSRLYN